MKRLGPVLAIALGLSVVACGPSEPELPPGARRLTEEEKPKVVSRERFAAPVAERPTLGRAGDTTCANSDSEQLLVQDAQSCLSLLKDTIKPDTKAVGADVKLARLRNAFFQPGPTKDNEPVGWILFATRSDCAAGQVTVVGNVVYRPDGVEISRTIPEGGPLALPDGISDKLLAAVCG